MTTRASLVLAIGVFILAGCGSGKSPQSASPDQSAVGDQGVIVHLAHLGSDAFWSLDTKLDRRIAASRKGEYDGNGMGMGGADFYAYGPDMRALWKVMKPLVEAVHPRRGSYVILENGPPEKRSTKDVRIELP